MIQPVEDIDKIDLMRTLHLLPVTNKCYLNITLPCGVKEPLPELSSRSSSSLHANKAYCAVLCAYMEFLLLTG